MTWDDFYDKFYDWSESTQKNRISSLTDFGPSNEVREIVGEFYDEKAATRFVRKAINCGVLFVPEEIIEIMEYISKDLISDLVKCNSTPYTEDDLDYICDFISDEETKYLAEKSGISYGYVDDDEEELGEKEQGILVSLLGMLGINYMFNKNTKAHNGKCNGECEKCPAHYGYRYGRWYYGHHHSEGCEFGGNK